MSEDAKKPVRGRKNRMPAVSLALAATISVGTLLYTALADVAQPVLKIAPLGSNQFSIIITNGVSTNYTLFWTPTLNDQNYPWEVLGVGNVGQTNFAVNGGAWSVGFFKMLVGADSDGDGILEWLDGQPSNPNVGILSITVDSPTNGSSLN